ncbi:MAG: bacillithiol biosynthesis deacetylase BshB1 [Bacteroidota bacterium]|nr:bacillithiol biosynthesis deacetylase BshB1 [Bacteroidota bacterium]
MHVDILVIMAHPDDAELSCSGTILSSISNGMSVGIIDLTKGELGTRGNEKIRLKEADDSAKVLGVKFRDNLGLRDGFFDSNEKSVLLLIEKIRLHTPNIIITNAKTDRHPDHEKASKLVKKASFLSGLIKIKTKINNKNQDLFRPNIILYCIQNNYINPDFVVDISKYFDKKIESIKCFKSQFYNPDSDEAESFISTEEFMGFINARSVEMGHSIGVKHGEGFTSDSKIKIDNLFNII